MGEIQPETVHAVALAIYDEWMAQRLQTELPAGEALVGQFIKYNQWLSENEGKETSGRSKLPADVGDYLKWHAAATDEVSHRINENEEVLVAEQKRKGGKAEAFDLLDKARQNVRYGKSEKVGTLEDMHRQAWFDAMVENTTQRHKRLPTEDRDQRHEPGARRIDDAFRPGGALGRELAPEEAPVKAAEVKEEGRRRTIRRDMPKEAGASDELLPAETIAQRRLREEEIRRKGRRSGRIEGVAGTAAALVMTAAAYPIASDLYHRHKQAWLDRDDVSPAAQAPENPGRAASHDEENGSDRQSDATQRNTLMRYAQTRNGKKSR